MLIRKVPLKNFIYKTVIFYTANMFIECMLQTLP